MGTSKRAARIANAGFGLLFAFSVVVQYNDPDRLRWMAMYAAACAACIAWQRKRLPRAVPFVVGGTALLWSAASALETHLSAPVAEALSDWQMHAGGSEELRETLGLLLIVVWMAALASLPREAPRGERGAR